MFHNVLWHTENRCHQKYPTNVCGVRDGMSGDILVTSQYNLLYSVTTTLLVIEYSFFYVITLLCWHPREQLLQNYKA